MRHLFFLVLLSLLITGCVLTPDYERPEFSAAKSWSDIPGYLEPVGAQAANSLSWQQFFNDPALNMIIGITLEHNKNLQTAALNIDEARAIYRINRADLLPTINAGVSATIAEDSDRSSPTGRATKTEVYQANLGTVAYELDLFGKIRSQNKAALNAYFATEQAQAVVRNSLIAEIANAYLQYLADKKLLSLTEKTLEAQQKSYDLVLKRNEKGIATRQDVARAQTTVETAQVNFQRFTRFVQQDTNALYLLSGLPQNQFSLPMATLDTIRLDTSLVPSLPSEVLLARPDVRQAEYDLLSRHADIGAARAVFYPSISLTGNFGFASDELGSLFASGASGAWSFIPSITLPIFNSGRNKANLDVAEIRKEKAILNYEKTIQTAFREVSDELAARATLDKQLKSQQRLVTAAEVVYDVANARYKAGIDSFLSVLDAQRELYMHQQNAISTEQERLSNLVNLYKVLGGGSYQTTKN